MKKCLFFISLAILFCSVNLSAQTKKPVRKTTTQKESKVNPIPKDSREYQVGKDGFEWYKVCKNGKFGAEDRNGMMLIPCEFNSVRYYDWLTKIPGCFFVSTDKDGMGTGVYTRRGECIIPISRNYHSVLIMDVWTDEVGAYFQYCINSEKGNTGICNIKGKKVFEANCHYDDIKPYYKSGRFFYEVGICDEGGWKHGIIDGDGNTIIPVKYKSIYSSSVNEVFEDNDSKCIIGEYSSIQTRKNMLADNVRLTASVITSDRSSNAYSSSKSTSSSKSNSSNSNSGNSTTTIHVEHHHDPVPMQQWQACIGCGGMGTMGCDFCGGSGTRYVGDNLRICSRCNGQGIIPCNVCYGNKGQYITVYR